jgi:outer membrane protein assembly factor BamB
MPALRILIPSALILFTLQIDIAEAKQSPVPIRESQNENDWPGFLGLNRDGKSSETGLNWDWADGKLPVVWTRPLTGGYGIGSVADGRYFQFDGDGDQARLLCLNARTGEEIWKFEYPTAYEDMYGFDNGPRCSPVIDEDRVYIFGVEGMLHCLNTKTGEKIWAVDTARQFNVAQNFLVSAVLRLSMAIC